MEPAGSSAIPATHPCLAGHFPGNPIVPGVVILEEVIKLIRQRTGEATVTGIDLVKFHAPLLPDIPFQVQFALSPGLARFECHSGDTLLVSGRVRLLSDE